MLKRMIPLVGALVLTVALVTGCQDSLTNTPTSSTIGSGSNDQYAVYPISSAPGALESIDAIANDPSIMPPAPSGPGDDGRGGGGRDTTRHGGDTAHHGGGDTAHHGGGDTLHHGDDTSHHGGGDDSLHQGGRGRGGHGGEDTTHHEGGGDTTHRGGDTNRPHAPTNDIGRILHQLNLTPAQDSAIRGCLRDLNDCIHADEARYRAALQGLRDSLQADLRAIRQAVENGRITREEGRRLADSTIAAYRTRGRDLEAAFKRAYNECWHQFDLCVRGNLTREQIVTWERLFHL